MSVRKQECHLATVGDYDYHSLYFVFVLIVIINYSNQVIFLDFYCKDQSLLLLKSFEYIYARAYIHI